MSPARIAGFIMSNFIGLAIILGALQFYMDSKSIWNAQDSFISNDYLVINKRVTSSNMLGAESSSFTDADIDDIKSQPWCREVGEFLSCDFNVSASVQNGERSMSTYMFFESIPDEFVDVPRSVWQYRSGSREVPIILSKDYLTLYNFGFATSVGLPQLSESVMTSIPLQLKLRSEDGMRTEEYVGRVAGFSSRLNTIIVPGDFIKEANSRLGTGADKGSSRLIVNVSSPGDVAISEYLEEKDYEVAGDKTSSSAAFMLRLIVGIVLTIGAIITLLSLFILMLSISLIMEKNRQTIHKLLMLGCPTGVVAKPYARLVVNATLVSALLAMCGVVVLRSSYIGAIVSLGAQPGALWLTPVVGVVLVSLIITVNLLLVRKRVCSSF